MKKFTGVRANYPLYDYEDIVEFLHHIDAGMLTKYTYQAFLNLGMRRQNIGMVFSPSVERELVTFVFHRQKFI